MKLNISRVKKNLPHVLIYNCCFSLRSRVAVRTILHKREREMIGKRMGTKFQFRTKLTHHCLCIFHRNSGICRILSFRRHCQYMVIYINNKQFQYFIVGYQLPQLFLTLNQFLRCF